MSNLQQKVHYLESHFDSFGLPVTLSNDAGDSAHNCGVLYTCLNSLNTDTLVGYTETIRKLRPIELPQGFYVRHPDPTKWYSRYETFSRDQSAMLQASMIMWNRTDLLWQLWRARWQYNKLMHFNTLESDGWISKTPDIPGVNEVGLWIRGFNLWILYPFLTVLDLAHVLDVLWLNKVNTWDTDVKTLTYLQVAKRKMPTISSYIATKLFKKYDKAIPHMLNYYNNGSADNTVPGMGEICVEAYKAL
jgi:hypothetical protein